jgi:TonB family protein
MSEPNRSEPDPLKAAPSSAALLRGQPERVGLDADFADLAARFAAHSGGGLSAELSADLALEIVLNEIVEQACLATGATGAAVVLPRDGEMMCRASSGPTAPELGARLDTASGLSGECVKTHRTQRCDDVRVDPRADSEASQRLGVRSVMVMPLLRGDELAGVIELFSSRAYAFGDRDEGTLEVLAARILSNLDRAARAAEPATEEPSVEATRVEATSKEEPRKEEPAESLPSEIPTVEALRSQTTRGGTKLQSEVLTSTEPTREIVSEISASEQPEPERPALDQPEFDQNVERRLNVATWILGVAVVACAVLLGVMIGRHLGGQKVTRRARPVAPAAAMAATPAVDAKGTGNATNASAPQAAVKPNSNAAPPPGGLRVYENGKEVFRMPPEGGAAPDAGKGMQRASSVEADKVELDGVGPEKAGAEKTEPEKVMELSPLAAAGSLLHRVEPEYPEEARQQQVQGAVVLEVHIAADGTVQDVQVVSGPEQLAAPSISAVKQWRFKPRTVNGRRAEMQTTVTLNFKLPQ